MKAEPELKGKKAENLSVRLGEGLVCLNEPALHAKNHSRVRLGEPNPRLGKGEHLGEAFLRLGEGPLLEDKTSVFT